MRENYKLYGLFVGLTATIMVTCDTLVYRVYDIHSLKITASGIIFSICFLLSTITTEVYGYKLGGRVVWIIVICQSLFCALINLSSIYQVNENELSPHYYALFGDFWHVMIGTWVSVPASYFCNSIIISRLKIYFGGKFFIVRYVLSSMITHAVLLLSAYPISLSSKYPPNELLNIIITTWSYKVVMSVILLPIAVFLSDYVKRIEKTDYYDWKISYNPISVFSENKVKINRNAFEVKNENHPNI